MRIAVASGKGGTGKTTVALALTEAAGTGAQLLDCDVEEPNCHLFVMAQTRKEAVKVLKPVVKNGLCSGCRNCVDICQFNAIAVLGDKVLLFNDLCHGCGGCVKVCPTGALSEEPYEIGEAGSCEVRDYSLTDGCLAIGQAMSPPLIRAVKEHPNLKGGHTIIDSPPGTSCPMVAAAKDADFVLLVTEPTPFGLHDLSLAVDALRLLRLRLGVIINRADCGDDKVRKYCKAENIPVMLEIANRRDIAEAYSKGKTLLEAAPELKPEFQRVIGDIESMLAAEVKK